jgi:GNAT superfamily N-acetyltransferase
MLTGRGYRLMGFENVLGRALTPDEPGPTGFDTEVARSGADELAVWLDAVVTGFATPDTQGVASHEEHAREVLEQAIGDMADADGFTRYLARRAGRVAGGAAVRMSEGVAQLCGAATLPAHRRRGVQTALLLARLAEAARAGCDLAVVTTLPGSRSQLNVQRRGFELLYTRAVLVREPG